MTKNDLCEYCEGSVEQRLIRTEFHFKGQTIYVENVPAWVCSKCGEKYYDAPIYKRLEEIASRREHIKKTVCFPLAEYGMVLN